MSRIVGLKFRRFQQLLGPRKYLKKVQEFQMTLPPVEEDQNPHILIKIKKVKHSYKIKVNLIDEHNLVNERDS